MRTARIVAGIGALALLGAGGFVGIPALLGPGPYEPPPYQAPPRKRNPAKGPNLLLVTLDTTRADRLGCYGNDLVATPRLDAFAASGARFENAFCPMPETDPSHASMMTGLEPFAHGVMENGWRLFPDRTTLAEVMRASGYTTYAAVSVEHLGPKLGFDQGFDLFDAKFATHERLGGDTLRLVETWLDDLAARPFFLWVHWFDAHRDQGGKPPRYQPPAEYLPDAATYSRYAARDLPEEVARYDAQIRYLDDLFGRLLDGLEARGALSNTVVAVLADHGETLHELIDRFQYGYTHGDYLYDHQVRVPFLLAGPGIPEGRVVKAQVRVMDLLPTLLSLVGLEDRVPSDLDGTSVAGWIGEDGPDLPVFVQRDFRTKYERVHDVAFRDGGRKLILSAENGPEFFDLSADPLEATNLLGGGVGPPEVAPMRERLEAWSRKLEAVGEQTIDREMMEALRKLGYVDATIEKNR